MAASKQHSQKSGWFVAPAADGKHVFFGGDGVATEKGAPASDSVFPIREGMSGNAAHLYMPAHHGPYYFHVATMDRSPFQKQDVVAGMIRVYVYGEKEPIAIVRNTRVSRWGLGSWTGLEGLGIEKTIHLIPQAKILAVIPAERNELRLYPLDLDAEIEKSGIDYFYVTSRPPTQVKSGDTLKYQIAAKTKKGGLTFKIELGPDGASISADGLLQWSSPAKVSQPRVEFVIGIKDATGKTITHAFLLDASEEMKP